MLAGEFKRFMAKVNKEPDNGCWLWTASLDPQGYARLFTSGSGRAARVSYEHFVGPIPEGLVIDHLCRTPACVNPVHLEAVTPRVNTLRSPIALAAVNARRTHCKNGHPFDEQNSFVRYDGRGRGCRACKQKNDKRYHATKHAALAAVSDTNADLSGPTPEDGSHE